MRASSSAPQSETTEQDWQNGLHWDRLDYGTLFVTSKRLVFICWLDDEHDIDDDESENEDVPGGGPTSRSEGLPNTCAFAVPLRLVMSAQAQRRRVAWLSPLTVLEDVECLDVEVLSSSGASSTSTGEAVQFLLDVDMCGLPPFNLLINHFAKLQRVVNACRIRSFCGSFTNTLTCLKLVHANALGRDCGGSATPLLTRSTDLTAESTPLGTAPSSPCGLRARPFLACRFGKDLLMLKRARQARLVWSET